MTSISMTHNVATGLEKSHSDHRSDTPSPPPRVRKQRATPDKAQAPPIRPDTYADENMDDFEDTPSSDPTSSSTSRSPSPARGGHSPRGSSLRSSPSDDSSLFNDLSTNYSSSPVIMKDDNDDDEDRDDDNIIVSPFTDQGGSGENSHEHTRGGISMSSDGFFNVSEDIAMEGDGDDDEHSPPRAHPSDNREQRQQVERVPHSADRDTKDIRRKQASRQSRYPSPRHTTNQSHRDKKDKYEMSPGSGEESITDSGNESGSDAGQHFSRNRDDVVHVVKNDPVDRNQSESTRLGQLHIVDHDDAEVAEDRFSGDSSNRDYGRSKANRGPQSRPIREPSYREGNESFDAANVLQRMRTSGKTRQHGTHTEPSSHDRSVSPQRSVGSRYSAADSVANSKEVIDDLHDRTSQLDPLDVAIEVFDR